MAANKHKNIPALLIAMVIFSIIVALLLIGLYFWKFSGYFKGDEAAWGQFGDYVGGILNPLFSLTALFALLHTIKLQSKELHESTEHLEKSAKALAMQNEVMVRQQFEHTFFQMLGLFNEVVRGMEMFLENDEGTAQICYKGKSRMAQLANFIRLDINNKLGRDSIKSAYIEFTKIDKDFFLGDYFRTLYYVIEHIETSNLPTDNKKFYSNIVRAQLSDAELVLLFYNCLCLDDYERGKFLPLVEKYDLLEYLKPEHLANRAHRDLLPF